jgi:hypothetical protein
VADYTRRSLKVYAWEDEFGTFKKQMFDDLTGPRRWARWAAKRWDIPKPVIRKAGNRSATSWYRALDNSISLRPNHWNAASVLHEMAHAIMFYRYNDAFFDEDDHGPKHAMLPSLDKHKISYKRLSPRRKKARKR